MDFLPFLAHMRPFILYIKNGHAHLESWEFKDVKYKNGNVIFDILENIAYVGYFKHVSFCSVFFTCILKFNQDHR